MLVLQTPAQLDGHAKSVSVTVNFLQSKAKDNAVEIQQGSNLSLKVDSCEVTGVNTICKSIAAALDGALLGSSREDRAQVEQWLNFVHTQLTPVMDNELAAVNSWLASRTYLAAQQVTLADLVLYAALSPAITAFPVAQQSVFCHLLRWYNHIHCTVDRPFAQPPACPAADVPGVQPPPPMPAPPPQARPAKPAADAAPAAAAAPAGAAAAAPAKAAAAAPKQGGAAAAPAAAAADAGKKHAGDGGKGKKGDMKKGDTQAKEAAAAPAEKAGPGIHLLDIRVGTIQKVQVHPEASGLYVEEIDVGEEAPRQILSGLANHVALDAMQGRRVVVVANLKPRKLQGLFSYGMVLCASSEAAVEPVGVPEGVPNGERVVVAGHEGDAEAQINPKKKILEALFPDMRTNADGVPCFQGVAFSTSKGPLFSGLPNVDVK